MSWLAELADEAEARIRATPYHELGPAARRLRDSFDLQDTSELLAAVRDGVYG